MKQLTLVLFLMALLVGCSTGSKKLTTEEVAAATAGLEINADSDSGRAGPLKTIYFDYNSATLTSAARMDLDANIEFLKQAKKVEIQIEGHCDERGGVQYNLALGERRANAVRSYLVTGGVERKRITTISFGKERPLAPGHDEDSWSKNRRGNFVITAIAN